ATALKAVLFNQPTTAKMTYDTSAPASDFNSSASDVTRNGEPEVPIRVHDEGVVPSDLRASMRILVIDDDRTLREGCASVLQVEGYNVTTCGRGDEALDMVRRASYDIVMVDLYMTPVPGMEILKSVLTIRPGTIVLVMTGNPSVASSME